VAPVPINDAVFLLAEKREQPMHVGGMELSRLPKDAGKDWLRGLDGPHRQRMLGHLEEGSSELEAVAGR
jgi:hypothetical protein